MLSILFPYRNKDLQRLKRSFDSLISQTDEQFEVYLIDYGSFPDLTKQIKKFCLNYSFVRYQFYPTQFQLWNKSRAINSVVRNLEKGYCFVADVDMIFHPGFVESLKNLAAPKKAVYFQVGFLEKKENLDQKDFKDFKNYRKSTSEVTGMTLFPVSCLKEINGFDEFYHLWGAEDTDVHVRLKNAGYELRYYDSEILLLHQWHKSYRSTEKKVLTKDLQVTGIVRLNHRRLQMAEKNKTTRVNHDSWGQCLTEAEQQELEKAPVSLRIDNEKSKVDELLFIQLPEAKKGIVKIIITNAAFQGSFEYKMKKFLGRKSPVLYSLKEVNDNILMHLISFY
ncbi:MAG: galactosyltransferase-related protein, partial [Candidatus Bathyarchaeota archaeon]|nr:galactosyltransferase-related protein [Candidatus Bathyarchaeota archaeon]